MHNLDKSDQISNAQPMHFNLFAEFDLRASDDVPGCACSGFSGRTWWKRGLCVTGSPRALRHIPSTMSSGASLL